MAKTDKEKKKIISDYIECENYSEVARKYNMSVNAIKNIVLANEETANLFKEKKETNTRTVLEEMDKMTEQKINILKLTMQEMERLLKENKVTPNSLATIYGVLYDKELKVKELSLKDKEINTSNVQRIQIIDNTDEEEDAN